MILVITYLKISYAQQTWKFSNKKNQFLYRYRNYFNLNWRQNDVGRKKFMNV